MSAKFQHRIVKYTFTVEGEAPVAITQVTNLDPTGMDIAFDLAGQPIVTLTGEVTINLPGLNSSLGTHAAVYSDANPMHLPMSDLPAWARAALEEVTNRR